MNHFKKSHDLPISSSSDGKNIFELYHEIISQMMNWLNGEVD